MTDGSTSARSDAEDFTITSRDVEGLIRILGAIADKLTRGEWGLLVSMFAAAPPHVVVDGKDTTKGTFAGVQTQGGVITEPRNKEVEDLLEQLRNARMSGEPPGQRFGDMVTPP
jgi:hypothetical protein